MSGLRGLDKSPNGVARAWPAVGETLAKAAE
jgi:hypothetical protein